MISAAFTVFYIYNLPHFFKNYTSKMEVWLYLTYNKHPLKQILQPFSRVRLMGCSLFVRPFL